MTTYTISIGTLRIKIRSERVHGKSPEKEISVEIDWRTLSQYWQTAKTYTMGYIHDLLIRYDGYSKQKEHERMAQWPPHSLFCEKRCCQKSMTSYMKFLKKELSWNKQGHIR